MSDKTTRSEVRRLASMVSVRFSPEEETHVREAAERSKQSVSGYVRRAALQAAGVLEYRPSSRSSTESASGALVYNGGSIVRTDEAPHVVIDSPSTITR
jgi:mobilization protein NikA